MSEFHFSSNITVPATATDLVSSIKKFLKEKFLLLNSSYISATESNSTDISGVNRLLRRGKKNFKKSRFIPALIIIVIAFLLVFLLGNALRAGNKQRVAGAGDQRADLKKARATNAVNKQLLFPLKNQKGEEVSKLKFFIEDAELRDEIIVKGERAVAVKGRTFLIINVKITNDYSQSVSINSRDYFRILIGKSTERLAPDIHNDPVEIQPISTKYTRVGFPIDDTDKDVILQVGEVSGKKESIKLSF